MDTLPNELLTYIISFLTPEDIVSVQRVNARFLEISRDNNIWKRICFENSRAEAFRRRQQLVARQNADLATLRDAIDATASFLMGTLPATYSSPAESKPQPAHKEAEQQIRAMANWDPAYAGEKVNFYQEYIHRHAPIRLTWLPRVNRAEGTPDLESVGMSLVDDMSTGGSQKLLSALEDGSVQLFDLGSLRASNRARASMIAETKPGLLYQDDGGKVQKQIFTNETEATDNVSIDNQAKKAYIATFDTLNELDLNTLQVVRRQSFPFPITALSPAHSPLPLTVGTYSTLHLFDPRSKARTTSAAIGSIAEHSTRCELIGGHQLPGSIATSLLNRHPLTNYSTASVSLSQPGPLSILHFPINTALSTNEIHVAGRFTSILHYDRRFWPKISGTTFSGARLSCLSYIPHSYIPRGRSLDLLKNPDASIAELQAARAAPGVTLIAAGEYKGKGSLELYGLHPQRDSVSSSYTTSGVSTPVTQDELSYRNRQTASSSRLLSVTPHGTSIAFSDGDGNLKWVERDGFNVVRSFNINTDVPRLSSTAETSNRAGDVLNSQSESASITLRREGRGVFNDREDENDDIIRKIIPRVSNSSSTDAGDESAIWSASTSSPTQTLYRNDLVIQTGEGRLGILGFGPQSSDQTEGDADRLHEAALSADELSKEKQERAYGQRMRQALERQADETRFVRGLGMGFRMFD